MEPHASALLRAHLFSSPLLSPPASFSPRRHSESGLRPGSRVMVAVSTPASGEEAPPSITPVYKPTPRDRELRTPHSGYHFDGTARVFFEGWYFKVSIPECRQSFCFMYSMENPAFPNGMSTLDRMIHGPRFTGVGAQILGADDKYICQFTEGSKNFWGSKSSMLSGNVLFRAIACM